MFLEKFMTAHFDRNISFLTFYSSYFSYFFPTFPLFSSKIPWQIFSSLKNSDDLFCGSLHVKTCPVVQWHSKDMLWHGTNYITYTTCCFNAAYDINKFVAVVWDTCSGIPIYWVDRSGPCYTTVVTCNLSTELSRLSLSRVTCHACKCRFICSVRWSDLEKLRSQVLQVKGLTPVCFR